VVCAVSSKYSNTVGNLGRLNWTEMSPSDVLFNKLRRFVICWVGSGLIWYRPQWWRNDDKRAEDKCANNKKGGGDFKCQSTSLLPVSRIMYKLSDDVCRFVTWIGVAIILRDRFVFDIPGAWFLTFLWQPELIRRLRTNSFSICSTSGWICFWHNQGYYVSNNPLDNPSQF
jgi:hypothetical protein